MRVTKTVTVGDEEIVVTIADSDESSMYYFANKASLVAMITALAGDQFSHYFVALVLIGFGWNFLYIGGSTLVASVAAAEERGRVQGVADLATTSLVAVASLTAGGLHSQFGWDIFILAGCVPVAILACGLGWLGFYLRNISLRAS